MQAALASKIERNVERMAAASFAAACAYAAYTWIAAHVAQPVLGAETGGVAAFAYLGCVRALRRVQPGPGKLPVPVFDLREYDMLESNELLLTERHMAPAAESEPLVLDDILAKLDPDSRVVRLFDPAAMPTPGQLKSRIDRHLDRDATDQQSSDAAQALHDALAELRRSIR